MKKRLSVHIQARIAIVNEAVDWGIDLLRQNSRIFLWIMGYPYKLTSIYSLWWFTLAREMMRYDVDLAAYVIGSVKW